MLLKRILFIASVSTLMVSCSSLTKPLPAIEPSALVIASCPKMTGVSSNTFGATTSKLIEVGLQYRICRRAAGVIDPTDEGFEFIQNTEGKESLK